MIAFQFITTDDKGRISCEKREIPLPPYGLACFNLVGDMVRKARAWAAPVNHQAYVYMPGLGMAKHDILKDGACIALHFIVKAFNLNLNTNLEEEHS